VLRRFSKGLNEEINVDEGWGCLQNNRVPRVDRGRLQFEILLKMLGVLTSGPTFKRFNRLRRKQLNFVWGSIGLEVE
jgi:hypothetical protein